MSGLVEATWEHMASIVLSEKRPFTYRDFLCFEVNGVEHKMSHGYFRNIISKLRKPGEVELAYNSGTAFYTLNGHRFCKPMTPDHMGVNSRKSDSLLKMIQDLPIEGNAVHDIRLMFKVKGIWGFLSIHRPGLSINGFSKDIRIPTWNIDGRLIRVTIHRTDTVSVVVACSSAPVAADVGGVISLSNALTRVEERLASILMGDDTIAGSDCGIVCGVNNNTRSHLKIPDHACWIVTMWHFGADASAEYAGEKFSTTWGVGQNILVRAYSKIEKGSGKTRIRLERQEYPDKRLFEAIEEKLNAGG
jgi:hypothetical protein